MRVKNDYKVKGKMTVIFTTFKGKTFEILIDTEDLEKVQSISCSWRYDGKYVYARPGGRKDSKVVMLHRFIMNTPKNMEVDHINHYTLDNRKSQLRNVTHAQNSQNRKGAQANNTSGVRGVYWHKQFGRWIATARIEGKTKYIGRFTDLSEAEEAVKQFRANNMEFSKESREVM